MIQKKFVKRWKDARNTLLIDFLDFSAGELVLADLLRARHGLDSWTSAWSDSVVEVTAVCRDEGFVLAVMECHCSEVWGVIVSPVRFGRPEARQSQLF